MPLKKLRSAVLAAVLIAALPTAARAADPVSFATLSGTCDHTAPAPVLQQTAAVTAAHTAVLVQYAVTSGSATFGSNANPVPVAGGQSVWREIESPDADYYHDLAVGDQAEIRVQCASSATDAAYTATFYDAPTAPTSFSGVASSSSVNSMRFRGTDGQNYVGDVTVTGGTISVSCNIGPLTPVSSTAKLRFSACGYGDLGVNGLSVVATSGTPAWTVSVHSGPPPATVEGLSFDADWVIPGDESDFGISVGSFTLPQLAQWRAQTINSSGQVASSSDLFDAAVGGQYVGFDGTDDQGSALPDGLYKLRISSQDEYGSHDAKEATVGVDGTAPVISFVPGLLTTAALTATITEPTSGVYGGHLKVVSAGSTLATATIAFGQTAVSLKAAGGSWPAANMLVTGSVEDVAGNLRSVSYVAKATAPPAVITPQPKPTPATPTQSAANTRVLCLAKGAKKRAAVAKPKTCNTRGAADSKKKAANLTKLKWSGWGTAKAKATGAVSVGFGKKKTKVAVTVTFSNPKLNTCGGFSYTALKVVSKKATIKQKLPDTCTG